MPTEPYLRITKLSPEYKDFGIVLKSSDMRYINEQIVDGDTYQVDFYNNDQYSNLDVHRRDYTSDDTDGDNGIKLTSITGYTGTTNPISITFTVEQPSNVYNFEYMLDVYTECICTNIGTGFNNIVYTFELQSDNKILIGGAFTSYSGVTSNRIIRLNSDGTIDNTFVIGTGFNNTVRDIKVQSDNKILIGGAFTSYSGVTSNRIIRLNSDGSIDNTFVIGTGFNDNVFELELQSDNKILVGGGFTSYSGVTSNRIIRLNSDGTIDNTFIIGIGFNNTINTIELQSDNKILVGGGFTSYSGVTSNRIIRLNSDGSIDNTFVIGTGLNGFVYDILFQLDGKILVGGSFTTYSGVTSNRIIMLNSDGTIDNSFNIGTGVNGTINTIELQSDNKILVGGSFNLYSGITTDLIVRLNSDGTIDNSFYQPSDFYAKFNSTIYAIKFLSNESILVGGQFTSHLYETHNRISKLKPNGTNYVCHLENSYQYSVLKLDPDPNQKYTVYYLDCITGLQKSFQLYNNVQADFCAIEGSVYTNGGPTAIITQLGSGITCP